MMCHSFKPAQPDHASSPSPPPSAFLRLGICFFEGAARGSVLGKVMDRKRGDL